MTSLQADHGLYADGMTQPTLFGQTDMAEITHPDYPGERLIACYNPFLATEWACIRDELLDATEAELGKIARRPGGPVAPCAGRTPSPRPSARSSTPRRSPSTSS